MSESRRQGKQMTELFIRWWSTVATQRSKERGDVPGWVLITVVKVV